MSTEVNERSMAAGDSNRTPVVTLSDRQVVVEYPSFREFISLSVSTLSEEGMFVEVQNPKAAGSRLSFVLRIVDGFQLMQGEAEVVAVRKAAAGQTPDGMSIRFQELDEPGLKLLAGERDSRAGGDRSKRAARGAATRTGSCAAGGSELYGHG
jgi:hypothetical protein